MRGGGGGGVVADHDGGGADEGGVDGGEEVVAAGKGVAAGEKECSAKYGMKRCSDGMFSANRASVFHPFFSAFRVTVSGSGTWRYRIRPLLLVGHLRFPTPRGRSSVSHSCFMCMFFIPN